MKSIGAFTERPSLLRTGPHLNTKPLLSQPTLPIPSLTVKQRPQLITPYLRSLKIKTLLVDNYDSYTYNLFQLLAEINGVEPHIVRNDEHTWEELYERVAKEKYDSVVISPGPGTPLCATDVGLCDAVLRELETTPVLGVCLGMQALAAVHGGRVTQLGRPVHGGLSDVMHNGHGLFAAIPSGPGAGFQVVRYHSLQVDAASLPNCLTPIAWTTSHTQPSLREPSGNEAEEADVGSVLMALAHQQRPHYGVQFHPESVATTYGRQLLLNFKALAAGMSLPSSFIPLTDELRRKPQPLQEGLSSSGRRGAPLGVSVNHLPGALLKLGNTEAIFRHLYAGEGAADTFWLDSASSDRSRFTYMGGRGGPLWQRLTFKLAPGQPGSEPGTLDILDASGRVQQRSCSLFDYLDSALREQRCQINAEAAAQLPFDFWGGYVGYLGYELKAECGCPGRHVSSHPDAALLLADRLVVADHKMGDVYLVAMHEVASAASMLAAEAWVQGTAERLKELCAEGPNDPLEAQTQSNALEADIVLADHCSGSQPEASSASYPATQSTKAVSSAEAVQAGETAVWQDFTPLHSREQYEAAVRACQEALHAGESYELCLTTNQSRSATGVKPLALYHELRRRNPAAHAAWLSFGDNGPQVCCCSPELFLRGTRGGLLEARPIKGTAARHADAKRDAEAARALATSAKDRAENLMIVDLLRNDLGRVCQVGSVHVPALMEVETFASMHHLVSTVRGSRRPDASIVDCLRAAFPGGSMTGAPKLRSMQILDRLESAARGVYSGSLGFIGFNDTFNLNIVIRTAVVQDGSVTIGSGGAVTVLSDPPQEYEEMRLKAQCVVDMVNACS